MHPEFPYIAFISAALVLLPVPWHFRAGNVATLSMIAWLFVVNIIYGVDAAVWGNTIKPTLTVWCDITTRILIGANIALPAACMSVCIHLEAVASVRQATTSRADKTRRQIREAILCFLVPMVWMGLHFIVQGHRYDIIEGFGCRPSTYVSLPAIFLLYFPALLMSVIASLFAATAIWHFIRRRIVFARHLENSNSGLNTSRYLRLIMMAISQLFISTAATTASLVFSVKFDYRPWTNWDDVHFNFSRIDRFPALLIPPYALHFYTALWWIIPISSVSFFIFFGFGQEAMREYSACWTWFRTRILRLSPKPSGSLLSSGGTGHFAVLSPKTTAASFVDPPSPVLDIKKNPDAHALASEQYAELHDQFSPAPMYGAHVHDIRAMSSSSCDISSYYNSSPTSETFGSSCSSSPPAHPPQIAIPSTPRGSFAAV